MSLEHALDKGVPVQSWVKLRGNSMRAENRLYASAIGTDTNTNVLFYRNGFNTPLAGIYSNYMFIGNEARPETLTIANKVNTDIEPSVDTANIYKYFKNPDGGYSVTLADANLTGAGTLIVDFQFVTIGRLSNIEFKIACITVNKTVDKDGAVVITLPKYVFGQTGGDPNVFDANQVGYGTNIEKHVGTGAGMTPQATVVLSKATVGSDTVLQLTFKNNNLGNFTAGDLVFPIGTTHVNIMGFTPYEPSLTPSPAPAP